MIKKIVLILVLSISREVISQNKDKLSADFHKNRRELLRSKMPKNSVAVFFPNPIRNRSNDVNYIYHQDPDFYYLTGLKETDAVLVLFSGEQIDKGKPYNEILYVRGKNPMYELWNGDMLGVKGASSELKIKTKSTQDFFENPIDFKGYTSVFTNLLKDDEIKNYKELFSLFNLKEKFKQSSGYDKVLPLIKQQFYTGIKRIPINKTEELLQYIDKSLKFVPELRNDTIAKSFKSAKRMIDYAKVLKRMTKKLNHKSNIDFNFITKNLAEMREVKTEEELKFLKKAIDISVVGQIEMMKAMKPHISEREIQGIHEFVYKKYGAEYEGYPSIVGAGNNGCVLHYIKNEKPHAEDGELVLMDLGAEYRGYTADVTRTIPTNGKFSKEQKAIYEIVLKAQTEGIKACEVGKHFWAPGQVAKKIINKGLADLGIISDANTNHTYFPHGTSHYLGLDVHDPGTYGVLRNNSVITVEPGIYIPEGSACDKKWWGIAIRIEDDILITKKGPVNFSAKAPRTIKDIEKMMRKKSVLKNWVLPKLD